MGIKKDIFIKKTKYPVDNSSVKSSIEFSKAYMKWLYMKADYFKRLNKVESIEGLEEQFVEYLNTLDCENYKDYI